MNTRNIISAISLCLAASFLIVGCGDSATSNESNNETLEQGAEQGKEYTSAYICPMHCEGSGSEEAGKCPVCGMAYVANDDSKDHSGHGSHDGHNH